MAHDRAEPEAKRASEMSSSTDPGEVIDISSDDGEATGEPASIGTLLALTEEGWDIDQQVKKLQTAAGQQPAFRPEIPRAPKLPSVMIPTPFELGGMRPLASPPFAQPAIVESA